jgi:protocatechuate 3,4-dioxygenase beta subunit
MREASMIKWQAVVRVLAVVAVAAVLVSGACVAEETKTLPVSGKALKPDGSPAAGALVEARSITGDTDWKTEGTATCGADGKFTILLSQGSYRVCAVAGDLVYFNQSEMFDVAADGKLSKPIVLRMEKGCKVQGSVVDISTGQPVGGVRIMTREGDEAESSDSGKWMMVLPKKSHTIIAVKEGYWRPLVNFTCPGDTTSVRVEIKPGGTIKGRVLDGHGQPIAGAWVGTQDSGCFRLQGTRTDSEGRFVLAGQDPDATVEVSINAQGYDYEHGQPVRFAAGQKEAQIDVTVRKTPLRMISGRVTRQNGSPVEGATVGYGYGTNYGDYASAQTDKDGRYTFGANARQCLVVASGPGLAPAWKLAESAKDLQLDFTIKPGHTVEGRIEDEGGKPVSGAYLSAKMRIVTGEIMRDNLYDIASARTDKDGKFKLENLPEDVVYAEVYAENYDRLNSERLKVDRKDYTLVLRKPVLGQICGTIVKDSDGKPVTDFNVRLDFSRNGGRSSGMSPGLVEQGMSFQPADGKFAIKGLTLKEGFRVVVTAPGCMQAAVDPVTVKPISENAYKDLVIRLHPAGLFEGSITEAGTGGPMEGVMVTAWDIAGFGSNVSFDWTMSNTSLKSVSTRTDASGKFRFESMPFSSGAVVFDRQGFAKTVLRGVRFSKPLAAAMEKGATVTGTVVDRQGKIPPGASLDIEIVEANLRAYGSQIKMEPDGRFRMDDLPPGECLIMMHEEGQSRATRYQSFELKPGQTYNVDWDKQGSVVVQGRVLQKGKPVAHAQLNANVDRPGMNWAGYAESGPDGSYRIAFRKPGTYFISCQVGEWTDPNNRYTGKTLKLVDGANKADFSLPCGSISGKLVDNVTGKPISGASVRFYIRQTYEQKMGRPGGVTFSSVTPSWWPENTCKTDGNGGFHAENLKAGKWMIGASISSDDAHDIPACVVRLADGEAKTGVIAKLPPTGSATFSLVGMRGLPKGTWFTCTDGYGKTYYPKMGDQGWSLQFEQLPVGKITAGTQGTSYLLSPVSFQVRPDETTKVPIKLAKGSKIVFRVKGESVDPNESAPIDFLITTMDGKPALQRPDGLYLGGTVGQRGEPASLAIKPGTYRLRAGVADDLNHSYGSKTVWSYSGTVRVTAAKDTVVEIPWE